MIKILCKITISIDLIDHVLEFSFSRILAQRPHNGSQFFGGDGTVSILVE